MRSVRRPKRPEPQSPHCARYTLRRYWCKWLSNPCEFLNHSQIWFPPYLAVLGGVPDGHARESRSLAAQAFALFCHAPSSRRMQPINLRGQNKVRLSQTINSMGPGCDLDLAPAKHDVRMMPLLLSQGAHLIYERQRGFEVRELVASHQMMLADNIPLPRLRQLPMNLGKRFSLQRWNSAAT